MIRYILLSPSPKIGYSWWSVSALFYCISLGGFLVYHNIAINIYLSVDTLANAAYTSDRAPEERNQTHIQFILLSNLLVLDLLFFAWFVHMRAPSVCFHVVRLAVKLLHYNVEPIFCCCCHSCCSPSLLRCYSLSPRTHFGQMLFRFGLLAVWCEVVRVVHLPLA